MKTPDGIVRYHLGAAPSCGRRATPVPNLKRSWEGSLPGIITGRPLWLAAFLVTPANAFVAYEIETKVARGGATFQDLPRLWTGTHRTVLRDLEVLGDRPVPEYDGPLADYDLEKAAGDREAIDVWHASAAYVLRLSSAMLLERMANGKIHLAY